LTPFSYERSKLKHVKGTWQLVQHRYTKRRVTAY
jgi:hypothetical protein